VDATTGSVAHRWHQEGVYVTEADFVPRQGDGAYAEDDGVLLSVLYHADTDSSSLAVFDAKDLSLLASFAIPGGVVSFHAHGKLGRDGAVPDRRAADPSPPSSVFSCRYRVPPSGTLFFEPMRHGRPLVPAR
jgi:hypothetical protein